MIGTHISKNGVLIPLHEATIPIDDLASLYGFGVYESIRLTKGTLRFAKEHVARLLHSAATISLTHAYTEEHVLAWLHELVDAQEIDTANVKVILLGGHSPTLYAFLVAPKFVEKKEYREGVTAITMEYERFLPQAKSLNMLPSYMAFQQAKQTGAFDALFIDRHGHIIEGSRSNFFVLKGETLYSPPEKHILRGITRTHVIACAMQAGWHIQERDIPLEGVTEHYDGAFVTNTSSKIVPLRTIGTQSFPTIAPALQELRQLFNTYIQSHT